MEETESSKVCCIAGMGEDNSGSYRRGSGMITPTHFIIPCRGDVEIGQQGYFPAGQ
jgi:hypothetical protein